MSIKEELENLKIKELEIYRNLYKLGELNRIQLLETIGGSMTNLSRFLSDLEQLELIERFGAQGKKSGRKPGTYSIKKDAFYGIGGFIRVESYGIGICNIGGDLIEFSGKIMEEKTTPDDIASFFAEKTQFYQKKFEISKDKIVGIGIAALGPVKKEKGIIYKPYHMPTHWDIVPFKTILEMKTKFQVNVCSIAETILLEELFFGSSKNKKSTALFSLGRGIGSSVFSMGRIGIGNIDMNTSLGHIIVDFRGRTCYCGKKGCLETFGSIDRINEFLHDELGIDLEGIERPDDWKRTFHYSYSLDILKKELNLKNNKMEEFISDLKEAYKAAMINYLSITRAEHLILCGRLVEYFPKMLEDIVGQILQNEDTGNDISLEFIRVTPEKLITGGSLIAFNNLIGFID